MKTQIHPALGIGIILVVIVVAGLLIYRGASRQQVDTSEGMTPELKARILGAYGGGARPSGATPGRPAPPQGNR